MRQQRFRVMDKERKTYEMEEAEPMIAAEPMAAYGNDRQTVLLSSARNVRGGVRRGRSSRRHT